MTPLAATLLMGAVALTLAVGHRRMKLELGRLDAVRLTLREVTRVVEELHAATDQASQRISSVHPVSTRSTDPGSGRGPGPR